MTDTARTLYATTVTFWTHYDPHHVRESDLGREGESGDGFTTGRSTEQITYAALLRDPEIGDDLLDFFQVTPASAGLPLCQVSSCEDTPEQAGEAIALLPHYDAANEITDWKLVCASHADGWFDDIPENHRVRYDLRPGPPPNNPHLAGHPDTRAVLAFGDRPAASKVPDVIAGEQGWTDETLGALARRFLASADAATQQRFNAFLFDVQASENRS